MSHPVAGFDYRRALTHPGISQLHAVLGLTEVDFLFVGIGTFSSSLLRRPKASSFRKSYNVFSCEPIHSHRASDVLHGLLAEISEESLFLICLFGALEIKTPPGSP